MKNTAIKTTLLLTLVATLGGCAAPVESQMYDKASVLTKLSAAVEATWLYQDLPEPLTDDELLRIATADDPRLLHEFQDLKIHIRKDPLVVTLLVCTKGASVALLEDVSCTAKLDLHHWRDSPSKPCEFTLSSAEICPL
jgi:hypothetical protein